MWADLIDAMVQVQLDTKNQRPRKESLSPHSKSIDHGSFDNSEDRNPPGSGIIQHLEAPINEKKRTGSEV